MFYYSIKFDKFDFFYELILNTNLLHTFLNEPIPEFVSHGNGYNLFLENGEQYLDMTSGFSGHAIIGWGNKTVINSITEQLNKICHIDYKMYSDKNREDFAKLLIDQCENNLSRVFFAGGSGAEGCEAAVHLSYQAHVESGNSQKTWYISREESYHGATTEAMALGHRPNLAFFKPLFPNNRSKVSEHNKYRAKLTGESDDQYEIRCVNEFEEEVLRIGPERVAGFVAETIMGGLVGDVPPTKNYWKLIREVCNKYNIHLILDEVWSGTGTSGKFYCFDWDKITPDFLFLGKTLAAGYAPLSAIITTEKIHDIIKNGTGRVENSTTFQGHSGSIAAGFAVQKIVTEGDFLKKVIKKGDLVRNLLEEQLKDNIFFKNVRGRGLRNSIEYSCEDSHKFGMSLAKIMKEKHNILISGKWHRVSFSPALTITENDIIKVIEIFSKEFTTLSEKWEKIDKTSVNVRNLF